METMINIFVENKIALPRAIAKTCTFNINHKHVPSSMRMCEFTSSCACAKSFGHLLSFETLNTVDPRYLEVQGTLRNIRTSTYLICRIEKKINQTVIFRK